MWGKDDYMWVETLKNGKYKFVERYTDYITGKQKRVSVTMDKNTPKTRKAAMEILNKKMQSNIQAYNEDITFETLVEKYRLYQEKTVKTSTYKRNYHASNTLMNILGKDTIVKRMTASYVVDSFLATEKSPGTLNEHLTRFKAIMRWAFQNDYIDDISFIEKLTRFKDISKRDKIKDKYLEPEEITVLLNAIEKSKCWHWYHLTKFLLLSGLRSGEAIALNNSDIDLENRVIHVTKTYDAVNKIITTPKTSCSIRDVYMQDELLSCINMLKLYVNECKNANNKSNDLFITNNQGDRVAYFSYDKFLKEQSKDIIDKKITPHIFRHTHASLLLAEGMSIDSISRRLGHENSKVTKEIYLHVTEKLKQKDNENIRGINLL